jgi:sec-independent protein translocase protein TatC
MLNDPDLPPSSESGGEGRRLFHQLLDGLESFRWLLIKSAAAIAVAMVLCLAGGNYLVAILKWPLQRGQQQSHAGEQQVVLQIGTNEVFRGTLRTNDFGPLPSGTNSIVSWRLVPLTVGTNLWIGLQPGDPPATDVPSADQMTLKTLSPMAAFTVAIDLAIYGGIFLAAPFVFFFIGQFAMPLLRRFDQAKRVIVRLALIMSGLFLGGVLFCYFLLLPIALYGSVEYSRWLHFTADTWRAEDYIGFVCKFCLGMGLGFELPVVLLALVKIGILNHQRLAKFRSYWLVINLVASAAITPDGNPLTMVLMAAPLQVLFEVSIWVARYWDRKDRLKGSRPADEPNPG